MTFYLYYLWVHIHIPYEILRDNCRNIRMSIYLSCRYQLTILSNEIFSIIGKCSNTIIAEIFGNVKHIPVVSFKIYIKTYFLKNTHTYVM